ncbi:MAG: tripartite tricarboxylate transporter TctB family protein [Clostridia bacterium]|nr:tripartite tricarboxylate transporter TctB family protein [Clostridia bacterium]
MKKHIQDRISGVVLLLLAITIWVLIPYEIKAFDVSQMGPRFFPQFLSIALMVLSGILILKSFNKSGYEEAKEDETDPWDISELRVGKIFLLLIIYIGIIEMVGFLISTVVIMSIAMYILKVRKWYHYVIFYVIVFIIYYVFKEIMYVQLP